MKTALPVVSEVLVKETKMASVQDVVSNFQNFDCMLHDSFKNVDLIDSIDPQLFRKDFSFNLERYP